MLASPRHPHTPTFLAMLAGLLEPLDINGLVNITYTSVADPGFDLRGGVDFVNGGGEVENNK